MSKQKRLKSTNRTTRSLQTSLLAATLMAVSVPGLSYAAEPATSSYSDQGTMDKALQDSLRKASDIGFIKGDNKGKFRPLDNLTRQELAVLLTRALKLPTNGSSTQAAVEAVQKAGLMQGASDGFRADQSVSRQELATVLVRVIDGLNLKGGNAVTSSDSAGSSAWAAQYVQTAIRLGLMPQKDGSFQPAGKVQRQDVLPVMLDLFQPRQETKTITKIDGDIIVLDGVPFIATAKWKKLLSENNAAALQGAVIHYDTLTRDINELGSLEIVKSGTADKPLVLHAEDVALSGALSISGNYVSVTGNNGTRLSQVIVQEGVSTIRIDTPVDKLIILSDQPVTIVGSGSIGELALGSAKNKVTLDSSIKVNDLTLPQGKSPSDLVTNYRDDTSVKVNGVPPVKQPSTSPSSPAPAINVPPVASDIDSFTVNTSAGPRSVALSTLFSDADNDTLTYSVTNINSPRMSENPAEVTIVNNRLVITPIHRGMIRFTLTADDGHNTPVSKEYTVTVMSNHAPEISITAVPGWDVTAGEAPVRIDLSTLFEDADGDELSYTVQVLDPTIVPDPIPFSINPRMSDLPPATVSIDNGYLVITPDHEGAMDISITAQDDEDSITSTHTITVKSPAPVINVPPVASEIESFTVKKSEGPLSVDLSTLFSDADNDTLTFTVTDVSGPRSIEEPARVEILNNKLVITPVRRGTVYFTLTADDGHNTPVSKQYEVNVTDNHAPTVVVDAVLSKDVRMGENSQVDLSTIFTDRDGDSLRYTIQPQILIPFQSDPATVSIDNAGKLVINPIHTGTMTITLGASDGEKSVTCDYTINVLEANHAPILANGISTTQSFKNSSINQPVGSSLSDIFIDPDGDSLTFEIVSQEIVPDSTGNSPVSYPVEVTIQNGSTLIMTPKLVGEMDVTIKVTDTGGLSITQTFHLKVKQPN